MDAIYKSHLAAIRAAKKYQRENGGRIIDDPKGWMDVIDDDNKIVGQYPFIIVGIGEVTEENPFGDRWEEFVYEP